MGKHNERERERGGGVDSRYKTCVGEVRHKQRRRQGGEPKKKKSKYHRGKEGNLI